MRKAADITPLKRGRPSKKQLITPKSAPAACGEASHVTQTGTKTTDVQVFNAQTNTPIKRNMKKRNGRAASVDTSGITRKKRRQTSSDLTAGASVSLPLPNTEEEDITKKKIGSKKSALGSRTSSNDKVESLLSKTVKQEALKLVQKLESPSKRISPRKKLLEFQTLRKIKSKPKKFNKKKPQGSKPTKEPSNDLGVTEIKRLTTTDGFWSSKASSRSNSPLGLPLEQPPQKQPAKNDSRTSTPDISPASVKRQSFVKTRADKDETSSPKPNTPLSELRRLRTTEGFSFPDIAAASPRTGSRDVSPSSGSSLDRGFRQNARSLSRGSENKNGVRILDTDQNSDMLSGKTKMKNKKNMDDDNCKLPEQPIETPEAMSVSSPAANSGDQTNSESHVPRFRKKKAKILNQSTEVAEQPIETPGSMSVSSPASNSGEQTNSESHVPRFRKKKTKILNQSTEVAEQPIETPGSMSVSSPAANSGEQTNFESPVSRFRKKKANSKQSIAVAEQPIETPGSMSVSSPAANSGEEKNSKSPIPRIRKKRTKYFLNQSLTAVAEQPIETPGSMSVSSPAGNSGEQTNPKSPVSRFRKKKIKSNHSVAENEQLSFHVRSRRASSFVQGFSKRQKLKKIASVVSHSLSEEPIIVPVVLTSTSTSEGRDKGRLTRHSAAAKLLKQSPIKRRTTGFKKVQKKSTNTDSLVSQQISDGLSVGDADSSGGMPPESTSSIKSCSSPEFVISDLLGSAELKRLNTTAGFWASTPDIGTVLGPSHHRRLRDADASSVKEVHDELSPKQIKQITHLHMFQKISVKPQSTLLQHRKKRLHALQNSLRKVKQQVSIEELTDQQESVDNISLPPVETVIKRKPKYYRGGRKRNRRTHFRHLQQDQVKSLENVHKPNEHVESMDSKMNTTDSFEFSRGLDLSISECLKPSGPEIDTFTDPTVSEKPFKRTWKRGRRRLIHGNVTSPVNHSSIKTRGRGKIDNSVVKSLEVLQNLEPDRDDTPVSVPHGASKVESKKTKLKKAKKKLLTTESDLPIQVSKGEIDKCLDGPSEASQSLYQVSKENEKDVISNTETITREIDKGNDDKHDIDNNKRHSVILRQNSTYKKDNLFESLGYGLLIPEEVASSQLSSDIVKVVFPLNESVDESHAIKHNLPPDNCDMTKCDVFKQEVKAPASAVSDFNDNCSMSASSGQLDAMDIIHTSEESSRNIPESLGSSPHNLHHNPTLINSSSVLGKWQPYNIDENITLTNAEPNSKPSNTQNDNSVDDRTIYNKFSVQFKEVIPSDTSSVLKNEGDSLESLSTDNVPFMPTDKKVHTSGADGCTILGQNVTDELRNECNDKNNVTDEVRDTFSDRDIITDEVRDKFNNRDIVTDEVIDKFSNRDIVTQQVRDKLRDRDCVTGEVRDKLSDNDIVTDDVGDKCSDKEFVSDVMSNECSDKEKVTHVVRDDISDKEKVTTGFVKDEIHDKENVTDVVRDDISDREKVTGMVRDEISDKEKVADMARDDSSDMEKVTAVVRDEKSDTENVSDVVKDDDSDKEKVTNVLRDEKNDTENVTDVARDEISDKGKVTDVTRDNSTGKDIVIDHVLLDTCSDSVKSSKTDGDSSIYRFNLENKKIMCTEQSGSDLRAEMSSHADIVPVTTNSVVSENVNKSEPDKSQNLPTDVLSLNSEGETLNIQIGKTDLTNQEQDVLVKHCLEIADKASNILSTPNERGDKIVEAVQDSASPPSLSCSGDISTQYHVQPSAETVNLMQTKKKRRRVFRHKEYSNTDVITVSSHSSINNSVPADILDRLATSADVNAVETKQVNALQNKEKIKKVRKRRRNAWQRGVLKKTANLSRKSPKQEWHVTAIVTEKSHTSAQSAPNLISNVDGANTVSNGLQDENTGNQATEFSPAVKKSLSNMLKKLQTNANLANPVLVESSYKGRFLRKVQPQELKSKQLKIRKKKLSVISNSQGNMDINQPLPLDKIDELRIDIPGDSEPVKRKRGRPKKRSDESLPKLTPSHNLPNLRPVAPWNKSTPPNLSPQALTLKSAFFDTDELKNTQEADFVCENVDDTDLHLYLSGVSDDEQSPRKESLFPSDSCVPVDIPIYQEKINNNILEATHDKTLDAEQSVAQKSVVPAGKESKKPGRPKIKGRKGRPPGIPMTEEERRKKAHNYAVSQEAYRDEDLNDSFESPQTFIPTPDLGAAPVFMGTIDTPATKFSLRKKSTRSPLEMLAMKRKQEEARYDLEQEKRQARLIHLREKRSARESTDGFSDDGDVEQAPENLMLCSVVLSDFVKKLQLDEIEPLLGQQVDHQDEENVNAGESPSYSAFEDGDDEDWCADLEEHDKDDWNDNRPYIPRLKLKRIIKKGTGRSPSNRPTPKMQEPNERQHEPIKIVIKTEPAIEPNEQVGVKSKSFVDSSKVDRLGFESIFMDFLKGKSDSVFEKTLPKRRYNISKPAHREMSMQSASDLNFAEILTLPAPIVRDPSLANNTLTEESRAALILDKAASLSATVENPTTHQSDLDNIVASSADRLPGMEPAEKTKRLSSADEEDEDVLILDLDDSAADQSCEDIFRDSVPPSAGTAAITVQSLMPDKVITETNSESVSKINEINVQEHSAGDGNSSENAMPRSTQRSFSNDEMGLMLESYNSQGDQNASSHTDDLQNVADNLSTGDNIVNSLENRDISQIGEVSQTTNIQTESDGVFIPLPMNTVGQIEQNCSVVVSVDGPLHSSETDKKVKLTVVDGEANREASNVGGSIEGETVSQLGEGESMEADTFTVVDTGRGTTGDCTPKETNTVHQTELLASASEKTGGEYSADFVALDNNNVSQAFKFPTKASIPAKKSGLASDNNKSPKHSTYHSSEPEEWKVKVIMNSDKLPSGKYSCKRCGFTTPSKLGIESHIYSHIPGVQFRCAYCESEFTSMAATSSHLKNTHSLSEAKLHISRHIDEKNFYDKEAAVFSDDSGQQSPAQISGTITNNGGQSPPVIISVVVSGGVGSSRGGRPSSSARRFVCTHCGFSTNVKEDAEHHVLDLHSSQSLFACLLCSENVYYTESEIKDHCATVHPARHHPYKKLPDFYDAEQLNLKDKAICQDDRENIFERMTSMFQDDSPASTDHKKKAKDYLYLQEGWREKTRVEADSTTAVDYTEEQSGPQTPTQDCIDESIHQADVTENEVTDDHMVISQAADVAVDGMKLSKTAALVSDDTFITSSAVSATQISSVNSQVVESGHPSETASQDAEETPEALQSSKLGEPAFHSALEPSVADNSERISPHLPPNEDIDDNEDDSGVMGLKIIQVVSLSGQEDIVDEQFTTDVLQPKETVTGTASESSPNIQDVAGPQESTPTPVEAPKLLPPSQPSASKEENVVQKKAKTQIAAEKPKTVASESPAIEASATSSSSSVVSPSFAGGLPLSYKCNACKVHTPYLLMMVKHLKARHPNMRCFSCPYCKTTHSFVSQKQLRHHVKQSHPNKFGRNEIALSEDAKKFVEAMVLPMGPECIRVGSRIVLEEDIHTCTYCQVKMISLANVYEHLNTKHSDLFEFVCPVCQSYKSKMLLDISNHCLKHHRSSLDTDKVHVSVPKNLFTALTCISKNGKYIEKNLVGAATSNIDKASTSSTSASNETSGKTQTTSLPGKVPQVSAAAFESRTSVQTPLRMTSSTQAAPTASPFVSAADATQPIFAIPIMSAGIGPAPTVTTAKTVVAFSSALFDTSSLPPTPQMSIASQSIPIIHNAAASSFLSPLPQAYNSSSHMRPGKQPPALQTHSKSNERAHGSAKNLPVLNVPTIKPRTTPSGTKAGGRRSDDHNLADKVLKNTLSTSSSSIATLLTTAPINQHTNRPTASPCLDNLPDDEPNPDAFKIFNLRPSGSLSSQQSASPAVSPGVPSVYPPVSVPMTSGYIQGPLAGFPPGMVISHNLVPLAFPFSQHQPLMLAHKQNPRSTSLSRHHRLPHPSSASIVPQSGPTVRNSISQQEATAATSVYLKKQQQQRELDLLKKQHQLLRQNQQQAVPRAHPAHQQPPSLSGQVYQPQPLPLSLPFDHQQPLPGRSGHSQASLFFTPAHASSTSSSPVQQSHSHSSPARPSKGVHKRSSSLYQCPYCPVMVTLRALEVASHIQQNHPGKQVVFKKID